MNVDRSSKSEGESERIMLMPNAYEEKITIEERVVEI